MRRAGKKGKKHKWMGDRVREMAKERARATDRQKYVNKKMSKTIWKKYSMYDVCECVCVLVYVQTNAIVSVTIAS